MLMMFVLMIISEACLSAIKLSARTRILPIVQFSIVIKEPRTSKNTEYLPASYTGQRVSLQDDGLLRCSPLCLARSKVVSAPLLCALLHIKRYPVIRTFRKVSMPSACEAELFLIYSQLFILPTPGKWNCLASREFAGRRERKGTHFYVTVTE